MKFHVVLLLLGAGLILLLCGCKKQTPEVPAQPETGGAPLDVTAFSFVHTASMADECFSLELTREASGVRLHAEELFSGGRVADAVLEESVLEELGELAGMYYVDRWDGFDKVSKHAMDGSSFTLHLTLADGSTVSAHGSNKFPENYSDVSAAIRMLYAELMERYGAEEGEKET